MFFRLKIYAYKKYKSAQYVHSYLLYDTASYARVHQVCNGELSYWFSALSLTASLDICCANWYRADTASGEVSCVLWCRIRQDRGGIKVGHGPPRQSIKFTKKMFSFLFYLAYWNCQQKDGLTWGPEMPPDMTGKQFRDDITRMDTFSHIEESFVIWHLVLPIRT